MSFESSIKSKKASIVINTKDRMSRLRVVLKALEGQVDDTLEVIVVFDGCEPKTLEEFSKYKFSFNPIPVIIENNVGCAAARNRGMERASGDIILFLDDDRIPSSDYVRKHIEAHQHRGVVLGERRDVVLSEDEIDSLFTKQLVKTNFDHSIANKSHKAFDSYETPFRRFMFWLPYNPFIWVLFYTGSVSVKKTDVELVGGFDEQFKGWGGEDIEWGYRFRKSGVPFIKTSIKSYHLTHDYDQNKRLQEAKKNNAYFYKKVKGDWLTKGTLIILDYWLSFRIVNRNALRKKELNKNYTTKA